MTGAAHADWVMLAWPTLSGADCRALTTSPRIQARLLRLIARRTGLPAGPAVPGVLAALAECPAAMMHEAAAMAGAAWCSHAVRQVLLADEVEVLVQAVGVRARGFALSRPTHAAAPAERLGAAALAARIVERAGICLAAWLADLPPGPRAAALPKLPRSAMDAAMTPAEAQTGLRLMREAVAVVLETEGVPVVHEVADVHVMHAISDVHERHAISEVHKMHAISDVHKMHAISDVHKMHDGGAQ